MEHFQKQKDGFTLVELIIVLVVLSIFIGIAAPSFIQYITKQQEKDALTDLHHVVAAAQSISNDAFSKNVLPSNDISTDSKKAETLQLAGVGGDIKKIVVDPTDFTVTGVEFVAENGVKVRYDVAEDPKYAVSDDSVYTELEKFIQAYQKITKELVDEKLISQHASREQFISLLLEKMGGTLPEVDTVFMKNPDIKDTLYWQPYYISTGKNGVSDSEATILFATPQDGSGTANETKNGWKAHLIYVNGVVYESTSNIGYSQMDPLYKCKSLEEVEAWLNDPTHGFKKQA